MRLLCFGYGYVAQALAGIVPPDWVVTGTTREGRTGPRYANGTMDAAAHAALSEATHVLISTPPHPGEEELVRQVALHAPHLTWLGYLSTTGVYGDHQGDWVNENTAPSPTEPRSIARLAVEQLWGKAEAHRFRLAGIYGPGRSAFDAVREGRAQRIDKPGHVFSRIHVADIAQALLASMRAPTPGEIYNLADDLPVPQHAVVEEACRLLGVEPPPMVYFEAARLSPMAQSFYTANRRVSSCKIKQKHKLTWKFPTYREGLAAILQEEGLR